MYVFPSHDRKVTLKTKSEMMIDSIYKVKPIDKTAALVTQKASLDNTYIPKNRDKIIDSNYWENPRPMIDIPDNPNFRDYTGLKFGRVVVMGYLGKSRWQCQCQCGKYFARRSKVLSRELRKDEELCYECYQFTRIKKQEYHRKTGKYISDNHDWFK